MCSFSEKVQKGQNNWKLGEKCTKFANILKKSSLVHATIPYMKQTARISPAWARTSSISRKAFFATSYRKSTWGGIGGTVKQLTHSVHWSINPPLKNTTTLVLAKPPLNCNPLLYIDFSWTLPPKSWIFQWTPKKVFHP